MRPIKFLTWPFPSAQPQTPRGVPHEHSRGVGEAGPFECRQGRWSSTTPLAGAAANWRAVITVVTPQLFRFMSERAARTGANPGAAFFLAAACQLLGQLMLFTIKTGAWKAMHRLVMTFIMTLRICPHCAVGAANHLVCTSCQPRTCEM